MDLAITVGVTVTLFKDPKKGKTCSFQVETSDNAVTKSFGGAEGYTPHGLSMVAGVLGAGMGSLLQYSDKNKMGLEDEIIKNFIAELEKVAGSDVKKISYHIELLKGNNPSPN